MSLRTRLLPALIVAGLTFATVSFAKGPHHGGPMGEKLDADGDGQIKVTEVVADAAKRAAEIDTNADGNISATELVAHEEKQRELMAQKRLAGLDTNGDGVVSTDEFAGGQTERLAKLDADSDGVITREEFRAGRDARRGPRHDDAAK